MTEENNEAEEARSNFIQEIIDADLKSGKRTSVVTRFPPEPNGYLHIGHAKSICLNFGLAEKYNGTCHLRFDDTNPEKEDTEYTESIQRDVKWLGFDWGQNLFYASDYFDQLYDYAVQLIKDGKAFVCSQSADEMCEFRGSLTEPGKNSPYRDRTVEENLGLFEKMKNGEFEEGVQILRAKIDMASPNLNMRDPAIYRIRKVEHHRTGNKWCIYPMYDFTHCLSDAIEKITHSVCTLEFEDHRPMYDWVLDEAGTQAHPQQIEFARLNLKRTVMSKRHLRKMVEDGLVSGWDDPRMPTISGMRRRGFTPASIRNFCNSIGVAKNNSTIDMAVLEHQLREDLNATALRVMAVLDPLKLVITNYPDDKEEELDAINNPGDDSAGSRKLPFSKEIYIERGDFMEDPPKKFFRLGPGREVRLKHAYLITCDEVIKDEAGNVTELHCTYDTESRGGSAPDGRKVRGTLHWVSVKHAIEAEVRLYDYLFTKEDPYDVEEGQDFTSNTNPDSLEMIASALVEPGLANSTPDQRFQFLRLGYFCRDSGDSDSGKPVFNRTISLKDTWAKRIKQG